MPDAISILMEKRKVLSVRKDQLKREYEQHMAELNRELDKIDGALKAIEEAAAPYRCKVCGGSGQCRTVDAAGGREERPCERCKGTGFDFSI